LSKYDIQDEPIVFSKYLFDTFLEQDNPSDCIALYSFYYYTAKWQRTNQVRATVSYVQKGLKWSIERVRKVRQILLDLNLIEDMQERANGREFAERYVRINFIWCKDSVLRDLRTTEKAYYAKPSTNALSVSKGNALSVSKEIPKKKSKNFLDVFHSLYRNNEEFVETWETFLQSRIENKHPAVTKLSATTIANKMREQCKTDVALAIQGLKYSIETGYRGVFFNKPKEQYSNNKFKPNSHLDQKSASKDIIDPKRIKHITNTKGLPK